MARATQCTKCGRMGVDRAAVLPGSMAPVCMDCFRESTGSCPLPTSQRAGMLTVHLGQMLPRVSQTIIVCQTVTVSQTVTKGQTVTRAHRWSWPQTVTRSGTVPDSADILYSRLPPVTTRRRQ